MICRPFKPGGVMVPGLLPGHGEVHLWWIDLQVSAEDLEASRRLLNATELERASRFRFDKHRRRFVVRRAQLRLLLACYLAIEPTQVEFELGARDKPFLAKKLIQHLDEPLELNLSDSEDVAVVGIKIGRELGVDVELVRSMPDAISISRHFFAESEQKFLMNVPSDQVDETFFRCWTRKEAYIKAVGEGLAVPLDSFTVSMATDEPARFLSFVGLDGEEDHWSLAHFEPEPGALVAVAARQQGLSFRCWRTPGTASWPRGRLMF